MDVFNIITQLCVEHMGWNVIYSLGHQWHLSLGTVKILIVLSSETVHIEVHNGTIMVSTISRKPSL